MVEFVNVKVVILQSDKGFKNNYLYPKCHRSVQNFAAGMYLKMWEPFVEPSHEDHCGKCYMYFQKGRHF